MVPELVTAGLLRETPGTAGPRGGRPVAPIVFDGSRMAIASVEITVSDVLVETADLAGRRLRLDGAPHGRPLGDPDAVVAVIATLLDDHTRTLRELGVDLGMVVVIMPAPLAGDPPVVLASSDFEWRRFDLVAAITALRPDLVGRCLLVNDANMATIAEAQALGGPGSTAPADVVYLKSLTGIGGGVITGGRLVTGNRGIGFEPGHILVRPGGRPCVCGRHGCFIAEAGPEAVLGDAGLSALAGSAGISVAVAELVERVRGGDPQARSAVAAAGEVIASVALDIALTFDPARVVLGGYWADVFDHLGLPQTLQLGDDSFDFAWAAPEGGFITPGRLGARAARIGAAGHAVEQLLGTPLWLDNFMP